MSALPVDGRAARWVGHREQRRAEIVDAAIGVIEREGPGATVEQIGAALGVTRQVVYRQFTDRADLDHAIAETAATRLVEDLLPHLDLSGDVAGSVRVALLAYVDYVEAHLPLYRFVRAHDNELETPDSSVRRVKATVVSRVADIARDHLLASGLAPAVNADAFATGLVGMADAVVNRWLDAPGETTRDEVVDTLVLMVVGVIAAVTA